MPQIGKNVLVAAIIGCALLCGVVYGPASHQIEAYSEDSVMGEAVAPTEDDFFTASDDSELVAINDDEVPMASGEVVALTRAQEVQIANKVISLVNSSRKKAHKSTLKKTSKLTKSAGIRAPELQRSFSHTRPNGSSWTTAFKKAGIKVGKVYCGENLAMKGTAAKTSYSTSDINKYAKSFHQNLMNSPTHKKNIMSGNYKKIGISVYSYLGDDGRIRIYLCEHFCSK